MFLLFLWKWFLFKAMKTVLKLIIIQLWTGSTTVSICQNNVFLWVIRLWCWNWCPKNGQKLRNFLPASFFCFLFRIFSCNPIIFFIWTSRFWTNCLAIIPCWCETQSCGSGYATILVTYLNDTKGFTNFHTCTHKYLNFFLNVHVPDIVWPN